eukprot:jgi/Botrbrau1/6911/Bobra.67_3s0029.1
MWHVLPDESQLSQAAQRCGASWTTCCGCWRPGYRRRHARGTRAPRRRTGGPPLDGSWRRPPSSPSWQKLFTAAPPPGPAPACFPERPLPSRARMGSSPTGSSTPWLHFCRMHLFRKNCGVFALPWTLILTARAMRHSRRRRSGENIVLSRALLEAVGVFAQSVGVRYATSGPLLRIALLPVLERLGDPAAAVASSAAAAFGCICRASGYSGLPDIVAGNADYIVDGLCAQLRELDSHPRAPALFAMLLGAAGLGPSLLPILAEPARAAIKGLSITARRKHPAHVTAFLSALKEICKGVQADAEQIVLQVVSVAKDVAAEHASLEAERKRREKEAIGNPESSREYFLRRLEHHRRRVEQAELHAEFAGSFDDDEDGPCQVEWSQAQWDELARLRARCYADAILASAAADVAGPLLHATNVRAALLAMEVALEALQALTATQGFVDTWERKLEPYVKKRDTIEPTLPQIPAMLPHVPILWGPLLAALKDSRPPVVEQALGMLASLTVSGGGTFMTNRVSKEAWPLMLDLLANGPAHKPDPYAPPGDERLAPAVIQRIRHAVLTCITRMARDDRSWKALSRVVGDVASAVVLYIGDNQSRAVRDSSGQAVLALAQIDTDAVWWVLTDVANSEPGEDLEEPHNPDPAIFPPLSKICPPHSYSVVSSGHGGAARARTLLKRVAELPTRWHAEVAARLQQTPETRANTGFPEELLMEDGPTEGHVQ